MKFPKVVVEICKVLDANKAQDILIFDATNMRNSVDFFILATATSSAHIRGIVDNMIQEMDKNKDEFGIPLQEGFGLCNWVVLSFGEVFVNVFTKEERVRYNLEKLLNDGKNLTTYKRLIGILKREEKLEKAKEKKEKQQAEKATIKEQKDEKKDKKNEENSQKKIQKEQTKKDKRNKKDSEKKVKEVKQKKDKQDKKEMVKENEKKETANDHS